MPSINTIISNISNQNISLFFENKITSFKPEKDVFTNTVNEETPYLDPIKIGHAELKNHEELLVFTCEYNKELTARSAKKQQFEIAKKILKEDFKDGAIFIFYDAQGNFRFSFIRRNYGDKTAKYSNWKRYTYYVEPSKQNKTFKNRIENCHFDSLDSIQEAFSVEPLNKQFYQQIAKSFYELISGKYKLGSKSITVDQPMLELPSTPYAGNETIYKEFAVRLIGRTIFCWFLKNKKSDAGVPLIPESWLSFASVESKQDYYHSTLEKLFFLALNKKMDDRNGLNLPDGADTIPFLNGGLFEAHTDDFFVNNKANYALKIPDEWFKSLFETLEQYNFTIDENSINDTEVSIDPEMLGTIFENLLAEIDPDTEKSARKATGSFYTPREIVDYMVEQSMVQYLKTKTNIEDEQELVQLFQEGQATTQEPNFTKTETEQLLEALSTVKILDPACGSGAFPMGALHKICLALEKLDPNADWWKEQQVKLIPNAIAKKNLKEKLDKSTSDYARKLGVIQNSIYGVDIQPIAAEISKLRSFLSLVIDENIDDEAENRGIEPLPNLEFKFVTANTLIGLPEEQGQQVSMFDNFEQLEELAQLRANYLQCSGDKKEKIKERFLKVQKKAFTNEHNLFADQNSRSYKIISWNPFKNEPSSWFDPQWMFGVEKFDVVIGNPPYGAKLSSKEKTTYKKLYPESQFKIDTYSLFVLKSLNILIQDGVCTYIIPNTLLDNYFEEEVRKKLLFNSEIIEINDLNDKVFNDAVVHSMIFMFKASKNKNYEIRVNTSDNLHGVVQNIPCSYFVNQSNHSFAIRSHKDKDLIDKLNVNSLPLEKVIDIRQAIKSGNDKVYVVDNKSKKNFKPIFRGKDIEKFRLKESGLYINYGKHLACPRDYKIFEQPKILIREAGSKITAALDITNSYVMSSLYNAILINKEIDLKYILGLLNSSLFQFLMNRKTFEKTKGAFTKAKIYHYNDLPVKISKNQNLIVELVDKIIECKRDLLKTDELEKNLDLIIYKLYNLTHQEVLIVDPEFGLTQGEYDNYKLES
ncbi:Eco57I restriction-modification methylase domain-containing protein [Croceibacter atlanticus]|uniref:Eco57I restriction-modification methylase domain-containing protein n=1 Tax=Croceibacter atlanticus TaxID=313588 RepID=UPI0030F8E24C